jgi:plasmid stabilization system protein ParE
MRHVYQLSLEAQSDRYDIWLHIAEDSAELADRIDAEFAELFELLARMPGMGKSRKGFAKRGLLFFSKYSYLSFI